MEERNTGCLIVPSAHSSVEPHLGAAAPLPDQFVVTAWRDCFDQEFRPIAGRIAPRIKDQRGQDSCVGHGVAVMKTAQEGVETSPRDAFRGAKKRDGDPNGWGTSIQCALDGLVEDGVAELAYVDPNPDVPREAYRSYAGDTAEAAASRPLHKSKQPFFVPRTLVDQTLIQHDVPVVTSCAWYPTDNRIGHEGYMTQPTENDSVGGHCFACIGWISTARGRCRVMVNSFGPKWGFTGLFFVPEDVWTRIGSGAVALDVGSALADVVARYEGKDVKVAGTPDHYRIEKGRSRKYADELAWWASGRLFGHDVFDISAADFAVVPAGRAVTIDEAPYEGRELVRQIRQHYGQL